jgi:two-component system LytT family response regulator
MIRAIIIDDEPRSINVLTILLRKNCREDVEVVATSNSSVEAKPLIEKHKPDVVFIDIEMPGMTGIDVIRSFENPNFRVVFITAYDAYAVQAFELSAIDYLLKPIDTDKVIRVIKKIKDDIRKQQALMNAELKQLEKLLMQHSASHAKIGIGSADKIVFVDIPDILYCEAQGAYTTIHFRDGKKMLASKPLGDFESELGMRQFFRIHHSILVNLNRVKEFQRNEGGYVVMEDNSRLEVSQRKRKDFLDVINNLVV